MQEVEAIWVGKHRVGSCDGWAVPWVQGLSHGSLDSEAGVEVAWEWGEDGVFFEGGRKAWGGVEPCGPVDYLPHGHKADQTGDLRAEGMSIGRRG